MLIEAAHGVDPLFDMRHEVNGSWPTGWIMVRANVPSWLVRQPIHQLLEFDRHVVDANALRLRIDSQPQLSNALTIHRDTARGDQLVAVSAGTDSSMSQHLIQPFH
jgi:hypothetical protein